MEALRSGGKSLRIVVGLFALVVVLILAGCGGGRTELTYRVGGTASKADVEYTRADGSVGKDTVSLPWEATIAVGSSFSFRVVAVNPSGSGTVTCEVLVDGESLGDAEGHRSIECSGSFSKKGSSMSSTFSWMADAAGSPGVSTPVAEEPTSPPATPTPSAQELLERGVALLDQGQYEEALAELEKALELAPEDANVHANLGTAYANLGRTEEAIAEWQEAIRLNPDHYLAHYNLGVVYNDLGQTEEAIAELQEAIRVNPDYAPAHRELGLAYAEMGREEEAIAEYQEALRVDPDNVEVHVDLGISYAKQNRLDEAIAEWERALQINPDHAFAHYNLGVAYANLGRAAEAVAEFQTYLRLRPDASNRAQVEQWIAELGGEAGTALGAEYQAPAGYRLGYPEGWTYVELKENQIAFVRRKEDMSVAVQEAPLIVLRAGPLDELAEGLGIGEITSVEGALQGGIEHFGAEAGEMAFFEVGGHSAGIVDISGTLQDVPFEGSLAFVLAGDWGFTFTGMAPPGTWGEVRPIFEAMVKSLVVP
ncbi:MAG TPA: tetratricopeptide repeat protein [Chloroflexi bacterium]|nr:tetratricopeptide repeat protein [Chloroflexota bacterium]